MVSRNLFLFAPPPPGRAPVNAAKSASVGSKGSTFISSNNNNNMNGPIIENLKASPLFDLAKQKAQQAANEAARQGINYVAQKVGETITRVVEPETPASSGKTVSSSSGFTLSRMPNPKITTLDSGVRPNTYTSDFIDAKENECSPLHVSSALVQFPTAAGNRLYDYFSKVTAFDVQTAAQSNVSFNLQTGTTLSAANILSAFNTLLRALQVYYFYASIMTYHSNPSNNNEGMLFLRSQITPAMQESLIMLGRSLANTPCPPRMLELVRYLSANYYTSDNQGSPMIKISPLPSYATLTNGVTDIDVALADLKVTATNEVYTLLRRAVPSWTISVLYDVDIAPAYDANFYTIFANLPFSYWNGTVPVQVPTVASKDTAISYNSFTNTLDGVAYALTSVYDGTPSFVPGLISLPSNGGTINGNTRKSYYEVAGVKGFYAAKAYPFILRSRQETYTMNEAGTAVVSQHLSGADKCLNVNGNSITETSLNAVDWMMSLSSIKQSVRPTSSTESKGRSRRRKK